MRSISADVELASHLRIALARTARRLRQESGTGLSPTLTAALATIARHGPLTPSELAARERVQRPTVTRVLTALVADHGYAGRQRAAGRRPHAQGRLPLRASREARPRGPRDARAGRRAAR